MFKKLLIPIAVLVAFGMLPSSAAANWQFEEVPISGDTFELHGQTRHQGGLGGIECTVNVHVVLEAGTTTAKADQFGLTGLPTEKCKGLGGFVFCQIHEAAYSALPLTVHITETNPPVLTITTGDVQYTTTGGFCPISKVTLTGGTVTATPDNVNAMKTVELSGSLTSHITTGGSTVDQESVTISGSLKVTPEGIYGI